LCRRKSCRTEQLPPIRVRRTRVVAAAAPSVCAVFPRKPASAHTVCP